MRVNLNKQPMVEYVILSNKALIWYSEVEDENEFIIENMDLLTCDEMERWQKCTQQESRNLFAVSHQLVRYAAAQFLRCSLESIIIQQRCDGCGGPHGKPNIVGHEYAEISWSHTEKTVAVAVADTPIGIDIEKYTSDFNASHFDLSRVMSAEEQHNFSILLSCGDRSASHEEFHRIWTYKECLVKLGRLRIDEFNTVTSPPAIRCDLTEDSHFQHEVISESLPILLRELNHHVVGSVVVAGAVSIKNVSILLRTNQFTRSY